MHDTELALELEVSKVQRLRRPQALGLVSAACSRYGWDFGFGWGREGLFPRGTPAQGRRRFDFASPNSFRGRKNSGVPFPGETGVSRVVPRLTDPERFSPTEDHDGVLFCGAELICHSEEPKNEKGMKLPTRRIRRANLIHVCIQLSLVARKQLIFD